MNDMRKRWLPFDCFPERRFDPDFPLALWFSGLWLYLKSFLYLCYVYAIGLDPSPYTTAVSLEMFYFGAALVPAFLLGSGLWHEKRWAVIPAVVFFALDTPVLIFHVLRLSAFGYLDAGLNKFLEYGSLLLNACAGGWLFGYLIGTGNGRNSGAK
ncbi:MAG: hypothetical protein V2B18_08535 [Pseudomonadota bacterium]